MISPFASPNIGGVESHLDKLILYLLKRNHKISLLTYQPLTTNAKGEKFERKDGNLEIYRVGWFGYNWFPVLERYFPLVFIYLFPGLFLKSLTFYLRKNKEIDVIHAHGLVAAFIAKVLTFFRFKRKVMSTHAVYNLASRGILKKLVKWVLIDFDQILATGEPSREELIAIGLDENKIKIDRNWVDLGLFKPHDRIESRKVLALPEDSFIVLFLGRFLEKKGVNILVNAAKSFGENVKFVFVGDGPLAADLEECSGRSKNVVYVGRVPGHLLPRYYSAADLFAAPFLYDEGAAAVYLESLGCGTPVITSNRGCPKYFLSKEVADIIEPSVNNIVEHINEWLKDDHKRSRIRRICREYALNNFSENNALVIENSYS
jgi:glycosyltransferase involved in cell wall biosynthesis